jgi:hypothetical protein
LGPGRTVIVKKAKSPLTIFQPQRLGCELTDGDGLGVAVGDGAAVGVDASVGSEVGAAGFPSFPQERTRPARRTAARRTRTGFFNAPPA